VLYWRESKQLGNHDHNRWQAEDIYRLLLMMGVDFYDRRIAEELYVVFLAQVFCQTDWGDRKFAVNPVHYSWAVELLHSTLYRLPAQPVTSWTDRCKLMYKLLDGQYGLYARFGLDIVLSPNWRYGPPTERQLISWQTDFMTWQWGWIHLCMETVGSYGRDWLWLELEEECNTFRGAQNKIR